MTTDDVFLRQVRIPVTARLLFSNFLELPGRRGNESALTFIDLPLDGRGGTCQLLPFTLSLKSFK